MYNPQTVTAALQPPAGIRIEYQRTLRSLCKNMIGETQNLILGTYSGHEDEMKFSGDSITDDMVGIIRSLKEKFISIFRVDGEKAARAMASAELKQNDFALRTAISKARPRPAMEVSSLGQKLGQSRPTPFMISGSLIQSPRMKETLKAAIAENVALITSIPEQYLDRIEGVVMRSIQANGSYDMLRKEIRHYGQMSLKRADRIAQDQTRKMYNNVTRGTFEKYGIKKFKWLHTGGVREPRKYHMDSAPNGLNGGIFEIDNPPVIDQKTGQRGFPAELPFCHCVMAAVIDGYPE